MKPSRKEIKLREDKVAKLMKQYEHVKVNLTNDETTPNGEGTWALPLTDKDRDLANNDSSVGEKVNLILCNQPVFWNHESYWGDEIIARTNGANRLVARISDNENTPNTIRFLDEE